VIGERQKTNTVISSGDKCYFKNKQDYVTRLGRGATLNRMVIEGLSVEVNILNKT